MRRRHPRRDQFCKKERRGRSKVSRIAYTNETRIGASELGGGASEVFTECADDIQGAINFAKKNGGDDLRSVGLPTPTKLASVPPSLEVAHPKCLLNAQTTSKARSILQKRTAGKIYIWPATQPAVRNPYIGRVARGVAA